MKIDLINNYYTSKNIQPKNQNTINPIKNNYSNVSFNGFMDIFSSIPKDLSLDADISSLSKKEVLKRMLNVSNEVHSLITQKDCTSKNIDRLDVLLNGNFVDYDLQCVGCNNKSLSDFVYTFYPPENNKLYDRFLITSLGNTMELPKIGMEKGWLNDLYNAGTGNPALRRIIHSYKNLDENSAEAKNIRNMLGRLLDSGMKMDDSKIVLAECINSEKPFISALLIDKCNISPLESIAETVSNDFKKSFSEDFSYYKYNMRDSQTRFFTLYDLTQRSDDKNMKNLFNNEKTINEFISGKRNGLSQFLNKYYENVDNRSYESIENLVNHYVKHHQINDFTDLIPFKKNIFGPLKPNMDEKETNDFIEKSYYKLKETIANNKTKNKEFKNRFFVYAYGCEFLGCNKMKLSENIRAITKLIK